MVKNSNIPINTEVEEVLNFYPKEVKSKLMPLRRLIYETAASFDEIGEIEETLKWGEPRSLTPKSISGSTIRNAWKVSNKQQYSIFFKCTANLVPAFKEKFPQKYTFGGNRSIEFNLTDDLPIKELKQWIALALAFHGNKKLETTDRWKMVEKVTKQ